MSYGINSGALSRGRKTQLRTILALAVTAAALIALTIGASSASAAFTASGFSLNATTTQAGGHPAVTLSAANDPAAADATGDDLKSLQFDLPAGTMLDPRSVPTPCPTASFNADNCSAETQVGAISITYRAAGKTYTSPGQIYLITPTADSFINFGIVVRPWSTWQKFQFVSGPTTGLAEVRQAPDQDYGLSVRVPTLPRTVKNTYGFGFDLTISNVDITLSSRSGWTSYPVPSFVTAPTRCTLATSRATFTSYANVTATRTAGYTPSGCDKFPFDPLFDFSVTNTKAGSVTGFSSTLYMPDANVELPIQPSHVKGLSIYFDTGTSINPSTSLVIPSCPEAQLVVDACPSNTKIGNAALAIPSLTELTGDMYKTGQDSAVQFAYILRGERGVKTILRGSLSVDAIGSSGSAVVAKFPGLPQVPWTSLALNLTSRLVNNAKNECPNASGWADFSTQAGNRMLWGTLYSQTGCPPDTTITSTTPSPTSDRTPSFTFTSTPAGATFECSIDYATYTSCVSGFKPATPLADGNHTFGVRAVYQGVNDPSPAQRSFTVQGTPPDTTLTSATPSLINDPSPAFTFTSNPAGATFECSIDFAAYASCASGFKPAAALADGNHTFMVRAVSQGLTDASPAQVSFTVDTTKPTLSIWFPDSGEVYTNGNVMTIFALDADSTAWCSIDTAPAIACSSQVPITGVSPGAHKLSVFARDPAGNVSTTLRRNILMASATGPKVKITSPVNGSTTLTDAFIPEFTVTSPIGTAITSTECRVYTLQFRPSLNAVVENKVNAAPCTSGAREAYYETGKLYRLKLVATDANGDVGVDSVDFTPGLRAPAAPEVVNDVLFGAITKRTPTFDLRYTDESVYPVADVECALVREGVTPVYSKCGTSTNLPDYTASQPLTNGDWVFYTRTVAGPVTGEPYAMSFSVGDWAANYSASTTTQKAGAHPDLDVDITAPQAGQLRAVDITLPKGLIGSLNSFPRCADIVHADCALNTRIGTVSVKTGIAGLSDVAPIPGDVFLTGPQGPNDVAGMVINVYGAPSPFADVIIPLHLELNNNAQEMRVYSDSIPTVIGNVFEPDTFTNFWVHDFKMHVNGSQGSPFPLLTNPSRCAAGNFSASFGDTEGTRTPVATVPYTATDCATLPFAPTITQAFSSQAAGQQVGVSAEVNLPAGNSSMKSITVTEPVELAPRLASFGTPDDQCNAAAAPLPTSTFNPSFCPPQAAVGTLTIDSPLLSEPLTGTVYLIQKSPLPWLGVALNGTGANQGVSVRIVGVTSTPQDDPSCDPTDPDQHCDSDVRVAFVNLPDLPYTRVKLAIDGPSRTGVGGASLSGKILQVAQPQDSSCVPNGTAKTTFAPNSGGASVNTTQTFPFTGCSG